MFSLFLMALGYMNFTEQSLVTELHQSVHSVFLAQNGKNIDIVYTNTGFQPKIITINKGDRITFVNKSDIDMRVASDPHPTHTDYPGFDAKKDFHHGQTFTFTFTKGGTYGFHNHMKSLHRGVVRIIDPEKSEISIDKTPASMLAKRDKLLAILNPKNSESIRTLFDTIKKNSALVNDCHDMAHDLGHRAYELYGFSRALTYDNPNTTPLNDIDDLCAGGYMHGVLEELFLNNPDIQKHPDKACSGIPTLHQGSCYHGVGHGIMFEHDRNLTESIQTCFSSLPGQEQQHRCYEGVYMELFWGETGHANGYLGWDISDPLKSCANLSGHEEEGACYLYAHLGYLRTHPHDIPGTIKLCHSPSLGDYGKGYCIKGIGITMMKHFGSEKLVETETVAKKLTSGEKYYYYLGVMGYGLLSGMERSTLNDVCNAMKNDTKVCLSALDQS